MKNLLLLSLLLLPCQLFAQKDAAISRSNILMDKNQSVVIPAIFAEFSGHMTFYAAYMRNGVFQQNVDLLPSVRKQALATTDSTQASRLFTFCLNNVSKPEIPAKYVSFKNAADIKEYYLEYTPVISINIIVKDVEMGIVKNFIIAQHLKMPFYCGIDKDGYPKLSDLATIKVGENMRGATSPESFDYKLDNIAEGIYRELIIRDIKRAIITKFNKEKDNVLTLLYMPKVISGHTFKMHVLSNKKTIEKYPEIDALNNQSKSLFANWATSQDNDNLKTQLTNIAQQYIEIGDKALGKNVSLMCYSNAALALAMCGDYTAAATYQTKAQANYKPFGTLVGDAIPDIYKQFKLGDIVKNQNTINGL